MASSTHWIASQVAMRSLERGGNAFDAAVTAGFVLHLVEPHLNGPGGEVPAILATAADPRPRVLSGQGPAPAAATIEHFRGLGLDLIPGSGPVAAAVPGAIDAWLLLLRDHGTQSLDEVLEPAIEYAMAGHPILAAACEAVSTVQELFENDWQTSAEVWLKSGAPPKAGSLFSNETYGRTLRRLVEEGLAAGPDREAQIDGARRAWREGFVAEAIDAFSSQAFRDSSGEVHAGLITGDDMAAYSATWEEPATLDWQGFVVSKTQAWGQGPVLLQTLAMLDALGDRDAFDPSTAHGIHAIAEAMKLAFADREAWYGDTPDVPLQALLSAQYATERASLVGDLASGELRPGSPNGQEPKIAAHLHDWLAVTPPRVATPATGEAVVGADGTTRGDTCHLNVVDRWGNMISATPSGGFLHGSPTIPELGFPLGTRMQMFWLEEGLALSLVPGRRPRTTLAPTLVHRDGQPVLACGSPGGDQQDQWQLLFLLRHLAGGFSLQEAIDAPNWHTRSLPGSFHPRVMEPAVLVVEDRLDDTIVSSLVARGHQVQVSDSWSLGRMSAVTREATSGAVAAAANPRGMQGYACGR